MAERRSGREITAREATGDGSRGFPAFLARSRAAAGRAGPLAIVAALAGVAAAVLLVIAEFSAVVSVTTLTASCEDLAGRELRDSCLTTGSEQHSYALLPIAFLVLVMTWGVVAGGSRPAAAALVVLGLAVVVIWLLVDLPDIDEEGLIGVNYDEAKAAADSGFYLELAGASLALGAGALGLLRRTPDLRRKTERPRREQV